MKGLSWALVVKYEVNEVEVDTGTDETKELLEAVGEPGNPNVT